ncbi:hypothetical protein [Deinococcus apachensis]|uniref:hypothetical protein n=1 Tax=Deinococcus apachensis TaxID=309886 RepID=UPI00037698D1|nr:hypothetical protein [Deinococcus apachensis]
MHPWTAITQLLDQEIGASIQRGQGQGQAVVTLPGAYLTAEEKAAKAAQHEGIEPGQQWQSRASGKLYVIEEVSSQSVTVEGVGEYPFQKFHQPFARPVK